MGTLFKNIVGTIKKSELFDFKLDKELNPSSARYFLIKRGIKTRINPDTNEEEQVYNSYIYSTGIEIRGGHEEPIQFPRCLDMFGMWRFSFNDRDFLNEEVIEIID